MILLGFIVICEKNYLDIPQKSILCHTDKTFSEYAKTYCWIHGTSYVREALRGKQSQWGHKIEKPKSSPSYLLKCEVEHDPLFWQHSVVGKIR